MSNLYKASNQWSTRPPDERFASLFDLDTACASYRASAREATGVPYQSLRVQAQGDDMLLIGKANVPATLTHWAFGQLAQRAGAPSGYMRELPATLAAQNLNYGLANRKHDETASILMHQNGGFVVRALVSSSYTRIWNSDVSSRLIRLTENSSEWQPAPAAFDGSRGLYASDHDMFAFLVDSERRIFEKLPGGGLGRGFFVWNSEVGAASFGIMSFLYSYVCGNHIVWGASGVRELRIRHTGNADDRAFRELTGELRRYADSSVSDDEAKIESARSMSLGSNKDEVLDKLFGLRLPVSRRTLAAAFDLAETRVDRYGSPRTVWSMVNGLTEHSQTLPFADERLALDRVAGKILSMAF